jgi:hypothetical protein
MTEGHPTRPTLPHVEYTQILIQSESHFRRERNDFLLHSKQHNNPQAIVVIIFCCVDATVAAPPPRNIEHPYATTCYSYVTLYILIKNIRISFSEVTMRVLFPVIWILLYIDSVLAVRTLVVHDMSTTVCVNTSMKLDRCHLLSM